jgi:hypothetical protein
MRKIIKYLPQIIILLVIFALVFGSCAFFISPVNSEKRPLHIVEAAIDSFSPSWVNLNPANPPDPRVGHSMVDLPGGSSGTTVLADTWEFRYDTNTWGNRNALNPPPPLSGQEMVYDPDIDKIILFGGTSDAQTPTSTQTWSYDYGSNSWAALNALNPLHHGLYPAWSMTRCTTR